MSEPIRFYKGEETGIVHENYREMGSSLFKDQYNKALNEIGMFMSKNDSRESDNNNIFAFIGDRGSGKTSFMESVVSMLEVQKYDNNENKLSEDILSVLKRNRYHILKTLDPSTFDEKNNILEIVVGEMFKNFDEEIKKWYDNKQGSEEDRRKTIAIFQNILRCLKYMSSSSLLSENGDNIAQLGDMSLVSDVQAHFKELVKYYLKVFEKDVLVIKIDDIDMQVGQASQMVEQLRKYFIQKNVLVLIAVNIKQLQSVIELASIRKFKPLIDKNLMTAGDISDMAAKYLIKFIPETHRIYMPSLEMFFDERLVYLESRKADTIIGRWTSVKFAITSLIYQKCRFLFYHTKGAVSPIVPRNLRELRHLLAMLVEMDDYDKRNPNFENKALFLGYFYNTWVNNNISSADKQIINTIRSTSDVSTINKTVVQLLRKKYSITIFKEELFPDIFSERNVSYNVSIADAYAIIDYVRQRVESVEDKNLIFFIASHYSILLYRYYDQITEKYQSFYKAPNAEEEFDKKVDSSIRSREKIDGFSNYEALIGGTFINTEIYPLLPSEQATKIPRDHRAISFGTLNNLAKELCEVSNEVGMLDAQIWLAILWIVEFFALCTSRTLDSRNAVNKKSREHDDVGYTYQNDKKNDSLLFDLGAFFFNITNIKKAYNRINPQFFKLAEETNNSLYNKLLAKCQDIRGWKEDRDDISKHALLSCVCIRNFEVLSNFINEIQYDWKDRSIGESNIANLINFFNGVEKFLIKTYDKDDVKFDEKLYSDNLKKRLSESTDAEEIIEDEMNKQVELVAYKITFEYVKVVVEVLNRIKSLMEAEKHKEEKTIITLKEITFKLEELFELVFCPTSDNKINHPGKKDYKLNTFDVDVIMTLLPNRDEFSLNTFLRRVRECCDPIFRADTGLTRKWYHLKIFEVERAGMKISRDDARNELIKFKKENNLL